MNCSYNGKPRSKVPCHVCKLGMRRALRADCPYMRARKIANQAIIILGHLFTTFRNGWSKVDKSDVVIRDTTLGQAVDEWFRAHGEEPK